MQNQTKGGLQLGSNPFAFAQKKNGAGQQNIGANKRVFNTPFGETPSQDQNSSYNGSVNFNNNAAAPIDDDFNFQADPYTNDFNPAEFIDNTASATKINNVAANDITFNEQKQSFKGVVGQQQQQYEPGTLGFNINNVQPDGGPGAQRNQQYGSAFTKVQTQNQNYPNINQQQKQQNQFRGVLPTQQQFNSNIRQPQTTNGRVIQGGFQDPTLHDQMSYQDDSVSFEEITTESDYSMSKQAVPGQQYNNRVPPVQQQQNYKNNQPTKISNPFQQMQQQQQQENGGELKMQRSESGVNEDEDELPLLEDLGIDLERIKQKLISVITQRGIKENADYDDMAGPLIVCVLFGFFLLLKGKVQFGYIYGFGLTGCMGIYFIINLLSKRNQYVELYKTSSILGYSLMPFTILAMISIFIELNNIAGGVISLCMIVWSTVTATRYFEYGLDMEDKKYLIAYPISLFYFVFMLLSVF